MGVPGSVIEDLNPATRPVRSRKSHVQRQQRGIECLRQRDVERVPSPYRIAQLPRPLQKPAVPEPLPGPVPQISYRLSGGRAVQPPAQVLSADHAHHLNVDHVWRYLVDVGG